MNGGSSVQVLNAAVPGRARFRVPEIRRRPAVAERVRKGVERLDGIRSVAANPLTGSVLIEWDPERQSLQGVLDHLAGPPNARGGVAGGEEDWKPLLFGLIGRLPAYVKLGWALARTPDIPAHRKAGLMGGVLYSLAPIDLVPGFIPVWGQLDDLGFLLLGIRSTLRACPPQTAIRMQVEAGLEPGQLDRDLRSLGKIARSFGRTVTRGALRKARAAGGALGRGLRAGARRLWRGTARRRETGGGVGKAGEE